MKKKKCDKFSFRTLFRWKREVRVSAVLFVKERKRCMWREYWWTSLFVVVRCLLMLFFPSILPMPFCCVSWQFWCMYCGGRQIGKKCSLSWSRERGLLLKEFYTERVVTILAWKQRTGVGGIRANISSSWQKMRRVKKRGGLTSLPSLHLSIFSRVSNLQFCLSTVSSIHNT